jgi:hypothetical protein
MRFKSSKKRSILKILLSYFIGGGVRYQMRSSVNEMVKSLIWPPLKNKDYSGPKCSVCHFLKGEGGEENENNRI